MIVTKCYEPILLALAKYFLLNCKLTQQLCYPSDEEGGATRRRLRKLVEAGLVQRHSMLVASRFEAIPVPVYYLSEQGRLYLAHELKDDRFLHKPRELPHPLHLFHHLSVSETHIALDQAVAGQNEVTLERWIGEFDVVNDWEPDTKKHFRLLTVLQGEPHITCSPDAVFMLNHDGRQMVFYVELERGGTGSAELVERKVPGYRANWQSSSCIARHFPETAAEHFHVILLAPTPKRRDTIRRAFREADQAELRIDLWRFASITEITPETFLHAEMFYTCDDQPATPLVRP